MTASNLSLVATAYADLEVQAHLLGDTNTRLNPLERKSAAKRLLGELNNLSTRCKLLATTDMACKADPDEFHAIISRIEELKANVFDITRTSSAFSLGGRGGKISCLVIAPSKGGSSSAAASELDERSFASTPCLALDPKSFPWSSALRPGATATVSEPERRPQAPLNFPTRLAADIKRPRPSGPPPLSKSPYVVAAVVCDDAAASDMAELGGFLLDATQPSVAKERRTEPSADAMDLDETATTFSWGVGTLAGSTIEAFLRDPAGATAVDTDRTELMVTLLAVQRCTPSEKITLKQALSNLLLVLPEDFHLLSIGANMMKTIAKIEVTHWNKNAIQQIVASLSLVPSPLTTVVPGHAASAAAVPDYITKIKALRSIAPYMIPSYVTVVLYRLIKEAGSPIPKELLGCRYSGQALIDYFLSLLS